LELIPCISTNCACIRVFERCEKIGQECLGPKHIVIREDCDGCLNRRETLHHLEALVGFLCPEDFNAEQIETLAELLETIHVLLGGNDNDVLGIASGNGPNAAAKVIVIAEGRNDYRHIFGGKGRWENRTDWLVGPSGEYVDDSTNISP